MREMHEELKEDRPVFDSALKKDDFPTLGRPITTGMAFVVNADG